MKPQLSEKLARGVYSAVSYALTPFAVVRLGLKSRTNPAYRENLGERFGYIDEPTRKRKHIHFHAVSVGEVLAAAPMIRSLSQAQDDWSFSVSVMTPTGRDQAYKHLADIASVSYLPFDTPGAINRFLHRIQPDLVVMVETELWPNLINRCHQLRIPTLLMNGRMSEKSAASYRRMEWVSGRMMAQIDMVLAQFKADADRFVALGCAPDKVVCAGSVKFDMQLTDGLKLRAVELRENWQLGSCLVWIAASTHAGEEKLLIDLHQKLTELNPTLRMILAPRHPERAEEIELLARTAGVVATRRSLLTEDRAIDTAIELVILDTLGELNLFYGIADMAFVGGSLVPHGGHNPIEPALWGLPILTGLYCHNFKDITEKLVGAGALVQCSDIDALNTQMIPLLSSNELRRQVGAASSVVLEENRGSLARQQKHIEGFLDSDSSGQ